VLIRKNGNFSYSVHWRNNTIIHDFLLASKVLDIFEKRSQLKGWKRSHYFWECIVIPRQFLLRNSLIIHQFLRTQISLDIFWETIVTIKMSILVIESSDFMRNIYWLASCFSKIKKTNCHFLGNQSGIAGVHDFILIIVIFWYELQLVDLCGTREIYKKERYRVKEC
jgi:hypothetical protein